LKVCETLAYAHAKGVIHRDLKPANVMVGAFGEVQVMDWGLAKVLGERPVVVGPGSDPEATSAHSEIRDSGGTLTVAGSVLGTPAFMPPEQAAGETEKIDRRSDVFGLGAVLCALLTGKPPYLGFDAESVRLNAVRVRPPRRDRRGPGRDRPVQAVPRVRAGRTPARRRRGGERGGPHPLRGR
jgi:serine/threonine protein kinase